MGEKALPTPPPTSDAATAPRTPLLKRPGTWVTIAVFVGTLALVSIGLSTLQPNIDFALTSGDAYFGDDNAVLAMTVQVTGIPSVHDVELRGADCQVYANLRPAKLASVRIPRTFLPSGVVRSTQSIDTHVRVNMTISEVEYDTVRNLMNQEGVSSVDMRCRAKTVLWAWGFVPVHKTLKTNYHIETSQSSSLSNSSSPMSFSMAFTDVQMTSLVLEISKKISVTLPETLRWFNFHVPAIEYRITQTRFAEKAAWRLHSRPFVWDAVGDARATFSLEASCDRGDKSQCWLASPPMGVMSSLARDQEATLSVEATVVSFATRLLGTHSIDMMMIGSEDQTNTKMANNADQMTGGSCFVVQWDFEVIGFACREIGNSMFALTLNGRDPQADAFGAYMRADWNKAKTIALVEAGAHIRNFASLSIDASLGIPERNITAQVVGFDDSNGAHEEKLHGVTHGNWMQDGDENNPMGGLRLLTDSMLNVMGADPLKLAAKLGLDWDDIEIGARLHRGNETSPIFVGEVAVGIEDTPEGSAIVVRAFDLNVNDYRVLNMSGRIDATQSGVEMAIQEFGDTGEQVLDVSMGLYAGDTDGLVLGMFFDMLEENHEINANSEFSFDRAQESMHFHFEGQSDASTVKVMTELTWGNICRQGDWQCHVADLVDVRLVGTINQSHKNSSVALQGIFSVDSNDGLLIAMNVSNAYEAALNAALEWQSMFDHKQSKLDSLRGKFLLSVGGDAIFDGMVFAASDWLTRMDAVVSEEASGTHLAVGTTWDGGELAPYLRLTFSSERFLNTTLRLFCNQNEGTGFALEDGGESKFERMFLGAKWNDPGMHNIDMHMHAALINENARNFEAKFDLVADLGSRAMAETGLSIVLWDRELLVSNFSLALQNASEVFNITIQGGASIHDAREHWLLDGFILGDKTTQQAEGSVSVFNVPTEEFDVHLEGTGSWSDANGFAMTANTDVTIMNFDAAVMLGFEVDSADNMRLMTGVINSETDIQVMAEGTLVATRNQLQAQGYASVQDHGETQASWLFGILLTDAIVIKINVSDADTASQQIHVSAVIDGSRPVVKLGGELSVNLNNATNLGSFGALVVVDTLLNKLTLSGFVNGSNSVHTSAKVAVCAHRSDKSVMITVEPAYMHMDNETGVDDDMSAVASLGVESRLRAMSLAVATMEHSRPQMTGDVHFDWMRRDDSLIFAVQARSTDRSDGVSQESEVVAHSMIGWDTTNGLAVTGMGQGHINANSFDVETHFIYDTHDNSLTLTVDDRDGEASKMHFVHKERIDTSNGLLFTTLTFGGFDGINRTNVRTLVGVDLAKSEVVAELDDHFHSWNLATAEQVAHSGLPAGAEGKGTHLRTNLYVRSHQNQGFSIGGGMLVITNGKVQISSLNKLDINRDAKMLSLLAQLNTTNSVLMQTTFMVDWGSSHSVWDILGSIRGSLILNSKEIFVLDGYFVQGEISCSVSASPSPSPLPTVASCTNLGGGLSCADLAQAGACSLEIGSGCDRKPVRVLCPVSCGGCCNTATGCACSDDKSVAQILSKLGVKASSCQELFAAPWMTCDLWGLGLFISRLCPCHCPAEFGGETEPF